MIKCVGACRVLYAFFGQREAGVHGPGKFPSNSEIPTLTEFGYVNTKSLHHMLAVIDLSPKSEWY